MDVELPRQELEGRCLRIYVRVKGIFEGLIMGSSRAQMPPTVIEFLRRFTQSGKFTPPDYWLPVEKRRLAFDVAGRLVYD